MDSVGYRTNTMSKLHIHKYNNKRGIEMCIELIIDKTKKVKRTNKIQQKIINQLEHTVQQQETNGGLIKSVSKKLLTDKA